MSPCYLTNLYQEINTNELLCDYAEERNLFLSWNIRSSMEKVNQERTMVQDNSLGFSRATPCGLTFEPP